MKIKLFAATLLVLASGAYAAPQTAATPAPATTPTNAIVVQPDGTKTYKGRPIIHNPAYGIAAEGMYFDAAGETSNSNMFGGLLSIYKNFMSTYKNYYGQASFTTGMTGNSDQHVMIDGRKAKLQTKHIPMWFGYTANFPTDNKKVVFYVGLYTGMSQVDAKDKWAGTGELVRSSVDSLRFAYGFNAGVKLRLTDKSRLKVGYTQSRTSYRSSSNLFNGFSGGFEFDF